MQDQNYRKRAFAMNVSLLSLMSLALLHYIPTPLIDRNLIDYDDLTIIKPLLSIDWQTYLYERLPDRSLYAFPITDVAVIFDSFLNNLLGIKVHWITQYLYFAVGFAGWVATASVLLSERTSVFAFTALLAMHPLNTEVIQWITQRRYVIQSIPIAWGTWLFFKILKNGKSPTRTQFFTLTAAWFIAILAYPNSILWLPALLLILLFAGHITRRKALLVGGLQLAAAALYIKLTAAGTGGWSSGVFDILTQWDALNRAFYFGIRSVGRATWNFFFPFHPAPFYNDNSTLGWLGLVIFSVLTCFIIVRRHSILGSKDWSRAFKEGHLALPLIAIALLIPAGNTILTFFDFMLADRHMFLALPALLLTFCLFIEKHIKKWKPSSQRFAAIGLFVWLGLSAFTIVSYAPLWTSDFKLMAACASKEGSVRCVSQAIRRRFFKGQCTELREIFDIAADKYTKRPRYSSEFTSEVPLYHAACIGLSLTQTPQQRTQKIDSIADNYENSPELFFGTVLSELREGNRTNAWNLASGYYAGPLNHGPLSSTFTAVSIYRGHLRALCEILGTEECRVAERRFLQMHTHKTRISAAEDWGFKITHKAAAK